MLDRASRSNRKAFGLFIDRWEKKKAVPYSALLDFAADDRFPSVTLTAAAQTGLIELLANGCGIETRAALALRADRALSLNGRPIWAEQLEFQEDGSVRLYAEVSYAADLRKIRKEYLR